MISRPSKIRTIFLYLCCLYQEKVLSFGSLSVSTSPKISGGGFDYYFSTSESGGFKFVSSTGGSDFEKFAKIKKDHVSDAVTSSILSSPKGKTGKKM